MTIEIKKSTFGGKGLLKYNLFYTKLESLMD